MSSKNDSLFDTPASERFNLVERISATTLSQVWHAKRIKDDKEFTIKQTKLFVKENFVSPSVFHELSLLGEVNYPHIIRPYLNEISFDFKKEQVSFCFENHLTNVQKIVRYYKKKNEVIPLVAAKSILFQLLLAIDYLHYRKIAHCNVIPANLVLVPEKDRIPGILKLMDFGYSRIIEDAGNQRSLNVVHPWYRAPEVLLGDTTYDKSIDIWACGCVFAEILTGNVLFGSKKKETNGELNNITQLLRITRILGPITEVDCAHPLYCVNFQQFMQNQPMDTKNVLVSIISSTPEALDLLTKMLQYNALKRITAREALSHPFFSKEPLCETNIVGLFPKKEWNSINHLQARPPQTQSLNTRSHVAEANQS
ncbi:hypothetical protein M9Y10_002300 [Tritrichomonas musculus]|uniref:Protein kinase domain-containing protein n=1 Tax=Tritrichomonas musculus TaxID=1915356 RepID=A0ABR2L9F8_9EUKA